MTVLATKTSVGTTPSDRGTLITWTLIAGEEGEPVSVQAVRGDLYVAVEGIFDEADVEILGDIGNGSLLPINAYGTSTDCPCILNLGEKKKRIAPMVIGGTDNTNIKVSLFIMECA